jgi:subtilisin family serine protease
VKHRVLCAIALLSLWISVSRAQQTEPNIVVALKPGQPIDKIARDTGTSVLRQIPGHPVFLMQVNSGTAAMAVQKLTLNSSVVFAESNRNIRLETGSNPATAADAQLGQSMAALLDGQTTTGFYGADVLNAYANQTALQIVGVPQTRYISTGKGTRIAFIDTGVDADHPALKSVLESGIDLIGSGSISEFDGVSSDQTTWVRGNGNSIIDTRLSFLLKQSMAALLDDGSGQSVPPGFPPSFGHGTLVAGVLHAVAPEARLVPIRAFDAYGNTTIYKLAEAIYRASDLGVNVVNMSFSTTEVSKALQQAVIYAQGKGVSLVASVGNESQNAAGMYPASYPLVSAVASTDFNDQLAPFSNYGSIVAVSAPGAYVVSTAPGGRYAMAWGTSFSAPIESGAIALVAALNKTWVGSHNSAAVENTAVPIDDKNPSYVKQLGRGRVYMPNVYSTIFDQQSDEQ